MPYDLFPDQFSATQQESSDTPLTACFNVENTTYVLPTATWTDDSDVPNPFVGIALSASTINRRQLSPDYVEEEVPLVQQIEKKLHEEMQLITEFVQHGHNYYARLDNTALEKLQATLQSLTKSSLPDAATALLASIKDVITAVKALPAEGEENPGEQTRGQFDLLNGLFPFLDALLQTVLRASEQEKKDWSARREDETLMGHCNEIIDALLTDPQSGHAVERGDLEARLFAGSHADSSEQDAFHLLKELLLAKSNLTRSTLISEFNQSSSHVLEWAENIRAYVKAQLPSATVPYLADDAKLTYATITDTLLSSADKQSSFLTNQEVLVPAVFQHNVSLEAAINSMSEATSPTANLVRSLFAVFTSLMPIYQYLETVGLRLLSLEEDADVYSRDLLPSPPEGISSYLSWENMEAVAYQNVFPTISKVVFRVKKAYNKCSELFVDGKRKRGSSDYPQWLQEAVEQGTLILIDSMQLVKQRMLALPQHTVVLSYALKQREKIDTCCCVMRCNSRQMSPLNAEIYKRLVLEKQYWTTLIQQQMQEVQDLLLPLRQLVRHKKSLQEEIAALFRWDNKPGAEDIGEDVAKSAKKFHDLLNNTILDLASLAENVTTVTRGFNCQKAQRSDTWQQIELPKLLDRLSVLKSNLREAVAGITSVSLFGGFSREERLARGIAASVDPLKQQYLAGQPEGERAQATARFNALTLETVEACNLPLSDTRTAEGRLFPIRLVLALKNADEKTVAHSPDRKNVLARTPPLAHTIISKAESRLMRSAITLGLYGTLAFVRAPLSIIFQPSRFIRMAYRIYRINEKFERSQRYGESSAELERTRAKHRVWRKTAYDIAISVSPVVSTVLVMARIGWSLHNDPSYTLEMTAKNMAKKIPEDLLARGGYVLGGMGLDSSLALIGRGPVVGTTQTTRPQAMADGPSTSAAASAGETELDFTQVDVATLIQQAIEMMTSIMSAMPADSLDELVVVFPLKRETASSGSVIGIPIEIDLQVVPLVQDDEVRKAELNTQQEDTESSAQEERDVSATGGGSFRRSPRLEASDDAKIKQALKDDPGLFNRWLEKTKDKLEIPEPARSKIKADTEITVIYSSSRAKTATAAQWQRCGGFGSWDMNLEKYVIDFSPNGANSNGCKWKATPYKKGIPKAFWKEATLADLKKFYLDELHDKEMALINGQDDILIKVKKLGLGEESITLLRENPALQPLAVQALKEVTENPEQAGESSYYPGILGLQFKLRYSYLLFDKLLKQKNVSDMDVYTKALKKLDAEFESYALKYPEALAKYRLASRERWNRVIARERWLSGHEQLTQQLKSLSAAELRQDANKQAVSRWWQQVQDMMGFTEEQKRKINPHDKSVQLLYTRKEGVAGPKYMYYWRDRGVTLLNPNDKVTENGSLAAVLLGKADYDPTISDVTVVLPDNCSEKLISLIKTYAPATKVVHASDIKEPELPHDYFFKSNKIFDLKAATNDYLQSAMQKAGIPKDVRPKITLDSRLKVKFGSIPSEPLREFKLEEIISGRFVEDVDPVDRSDYEILFPDYYPESLRKNLNCEEFEKNIKSRLDEILNDEEYQRTVDYFLKGNQSRIINEFNEICLNNKSFDIPAPLNQDLIKPLRAYANGETKLQQITGPDGHIIPTLVFLPHPEDANKGILISLIGNDNEVFVVQHPGFSEDFRVIVQPQGEKRILCTNGHCIKNNTLSLENNKNFYDFIKPHLSLEDLNEAETHKAGEIWQYKVDKEGKAGVDPLDAKVTFYKAPFHTVPAKSFYGTEYINKLNRDWDTFILSKDETTKAQLADFFSKVGEIGLGFTPLISSKKIKIATMVGSWALSSGSKFYKEHFTADTPHLREKYGDEANLHAIKVITDFTLGQVPRKLVERPAQEQSGLKKISDTSGATSESHSVPSDDSNIVTLVDNVESTQIADGGGEATRTQPVERVTTKIATLPSAENNRKIINIPPPANKNTPEAKADAHNKLNSTTNKGIRTKEPETVNAPNTKVNPDPVADAETVAPAGNRKPAETAGESVLDQSVKGGKLAEPVEERTAPSAATTSVGISGGATRTQPIERVTTKIATLPSAENNRKIINIPPPANKNTPEAKADAHNKLNSPTKKGVFAKEPETVNAPNTKVNSDPVANAKTVAPAGNRKPAEATGESVLNQSVKGVKLAEPVEERTASSAATNSVEISDGATRTQPVERVTTKIATLPSAENNQKIINIPPPANKNTPGAKVDAHNQLNSPTKKGVSAKEPETVNASNTKANRKHDNSHPGDTRGAVRANQLTNEQTALKEEIHQTLFSKSSRPDDLENFLTNPHNNCYNSTLTTLATLQKAGYVPKVIGVMVMPSSSKNMPANHYAVTIEKNGVEMVVDLTVSQFDPSLGIDAAIQPRPVWERQLVNSPGLKGKAIVTKDYPNLYDAAKEIGNYNFSGTYYDMSFFESGDYRAFNISDATKKRISADYDAILKDHSKLLNETKKYESTAELNREHKKTKEKLVKLSNKNSSGTEYEKLTGELSKIEGKLEKLQTLSDYNKDLYSLGRIKFKFNILSGKDVAKTNLTRLSEKDKASLKDVVSEDLSNAVLKEPPYKGVLVTLSGKKYIKLDTGKYVPFTFLNDNQGIISDKIVVSYDKHGWH